MKVELIDYMGSDLTVVNAARVSFNKESDWDQEPYPGWGSEYKLSEKDQKLISYLAKYNHWTPFSHVVLTMRETVPIFVARQRFKHMVGFTYNEISRRYVNDKVEFYYPEDWREASNNKKQGSNGPLNPEHQEHINSRYDRVMFLAESLYTELIEEGVASEQARMVLPQSMYTSYYVTGSLAAWARAYKLRSDPHAQKEIQDLAEQWHQIILSIPELKHSWNALVN